MFQLKSLHWHLNMIYKNLKTTLWKKWFGSHGNNQTVSWRYWSNHTKINIWSQNGCYMTPKTFYISDIYESFLAVMLFLFLPVIVIPVVWPKNHFLFVRNWLRFWILPSGWNFIKSKMNYPGLNFTGSVFCYGFFYFCFYHYNYYWGGGMFTLFPCVCILCSLWNIKSISVFETRKKVYFIKIFLTLTKVFIS